MPPRMAEIGGGKLGHGSSVMVSRADHKLAL
jgi:hypothetical protein